MSRPPNHDQAFFCWPAYSRFDPPALAAAPPPSLELSGTTRSSPPRAAHRRRGRLRTRSGSACRDTSTAPAGDRARGRSVRQYLEDDVPLRRAVAAMSKRREAQGVSGAVSKIEPAMQRVRRLLGISQPRQCRLHEAGEFVCIGFLRQDIPWSCETVKLRLGGRRWTCSSGRSGRCRRYPCAARRSTTAGSRRP